MIDRFEKVLLLVNFAKCSFWVQFGSVSSVGLNFAPRLLQFHSDPPGLGGSDLTNFHEIFSSFLRIINDTNYSANNNCARSWLHQCTVGAGAISCAFKVSEVPGGKTVSRMPGGKTVSRVPGVKNLSRVPGGKTVLRVPGGKNFESSMFFDKNKTWNIKSYFVSRVNFSFKLIKNMKDINDIKDKFPE